MPPEYFHTLATFHDILEEYEDGLRASEKACKLSNLDPKQLADLSDLDFLDKISKCSESEKEMLFLHEKLKLSTESLKLPANSDEFVAKVDVRNSEDLSKEDFLSEYVNAGKPVIITGLLDKVSKSGRTWDLDFISEKAGECSKNIRIRGI
jgi:hypothetical protein